MQYIGNNQITAKYVGNTEVQKQYLGDTLVWEKESQHDYSQDYLTFKITASGNIRWMNINTSYPDPVKTIYYSKDNGANWFTITSSVGAEQAPFTGGTLLPVSTGDVVLFKGYFGNYGGSTYYAAFEGSDAGFEVCGNIMSMLHGDNFTTATTISGATHIFRNFLSKCSGLTSAENLILPTNVYQECYAWMFQDCISLTKAPVLPATNGVNRCYHAMFQRSSSLNYVKCMLTSGMSNIGTSWLKEVSPTGTFVKATGASWGTGDNGIPSGWTVLEE